MKITKILLSTLATVILFGSLNNLKAHGFDIPEDVEKSALFTAATSLDVPAVKKALAASPTTTQSAADKKKNDDIAQAVLGFMVGMVLPEVAYRLEKGDSQSPSNERDQITLTQAYARAMEITKLLIDNTSEETVIEYLPGIAQMSRSPKTARELITYMLVDKKIKPKKEVLSSALYRAASEKNPELITLLIEHGADVNFIDPAYADRKHTPLHNAQDQKTFELLIAKGANVQAKNNAGDTPLHAVAHTKEMANIDLLLNLLKKGANINAKNNAGQTPLQLFIFWNLQSPILDTIKFFITHGADSTITDNDGFTPLATFIAEFDHTKYNFSTKTITKQEQDDIVNYLKKEMNKKMSAADIETQATLGAKKHEEITAKETVVTNERNIRNAFNAAGSDFKKMTELITTGKIDVNIKGIDRSTQGQTLLHRAVAYYYDNDSLETIKFLVQNNIDLYALDKENRTALDLAKEKLKEIDKDSYSGKLLQKAIDYLTQEMAKKPAASTPVKEKK